ncbi:unnamed protein product [Heligmosomoides polygyrus]|uniref:Sulfate_transp domain-containing protein n=1 Tax=Heligmosomoides polygyrus TaxID=6339 RepID=A0A183G2J3_HELPZ|nr:unnamed protein product [Heligmosomoides polygyrus]
MWLLHLSFLSTYLSDSVVSGLTFGAAIHAFVAQLSGLLGIRLGRTNQGVFQLLSKVKGLAVALPGTNVATLTISIVTISFLVSFKHFVDPILKKRKIPVPSELVVPAIFEKLIICLSKYIGDGPHIQLPKTEVALQAGFRREFCELLNSFEEMMVHSKLKSLEMFNPMEV